MAREAGWPGTFSHRNVSFHSLSAAMADQLSLEQRLAKEAAAALSKSFSLPRWIGANVPMAVVYCVCLPSLTRDTQSLHRALS
jgi:hypothetical protein